MMQRAHRSTLALLLVAGISMVMLFGFGFRAMQTASQCEASTLSCRYTHMIMAAKAPMEP